MKAIGIVGSPRKNGNTDTIVQAVLDGATEAGYETIKYRLNEMAYSGCQACRSCKETGHCQVDDDASRLLQAMEKADAVIFGSPILFSQLAGQFRLFQDRMYSFLSSDFKVNFPPGKKAVIVTSQGGPDPTAHTSVIQQFAQMLQWYGFEVMDTIIMTGGGNPAAVKERKDLLEQANTAGQSLGDA